jgi:hypothetical protein
MNKKLFAAPLIAALALCIAPRISAQAIAPQAVAVGSSGSFTSVSLSMANPDPIINPGGAAYCGSEAWTAKGSAANGLVFANDGRNNGVIGNPVPVEYGNVSIVWDNDTTPTKVCVYLSVDSVVGMRLYLGQGAGGNATIQLGAAAQTTAGANAVSFLKDVCGAGPGCAGLPLNIFNSVNGAHFNMAFTDIRPEDAQLAYGRASCAPADQVTCFGYGGAGGIGTAIQSSMSQTSAQVVAFAISGTDPISTLPIPAFSTIPVAAQVVVPFYNTNNLAANGLGTLLPTDIQSKVLAGFAAGLNGDLRTFIVRTPAAPGGLVNFLIREPVSGTYNTFEFQVPHSRDGNTDYSQETGISSAFASNCFVPPSPATFADPAFAGSCQNPVQVTNTSGSKRWRVIGTGEMVNTVNSSPATENRMGYAFFGLGTFGGKANVRYLTLDGVDGINTTYAGGTFPNCTGFFNAAPAFSCVGALPTFANIAQGDYRLWNILRAVTATPTPAFQANLILAAQDQAKSNVPDFLPVSYCKTVVAGACTATASNIGVFRSHYNLNGIAGNNGTNAGYGTGVEAGGDMAGAVLTIQADVDQFGWSGNEFLTWIQ